MQQVAVIGLGSMGLGMASSLLRAGRTVHGHDISGDARAGWSAQGGISRETAREAAQDAGAAFLVVVNSAQSEAALFGNDGVLEGLRPGGVVISCTTMAPREAIRLAEAVTAAGFVYLDAPISGGAAKANSGRLSVMASGSDEAFRLAQPLLAVTAEKVHRLGSQPGLGSSFKIVNQLLAGVHIAVACEAITLAKRLGLDLNKVYEVITSSAGNSWMFEDRVPHILSGDYSPRSAVNIFTKDLGIVSDIGRDTRFPLPMTAAALQMFIMTAAAGMGGDDDASIARLLAKVAGLELPPAMPAR